MKEKHYSNPTIKTVEKVKRAILESEKILPMSAYQKLLHLSHYTTRAVLNYLAERKEIEIIELGRFILVKKIEVKNQ